MSPKRRHDILETYTKVFSFILPDKIWKIFNGEE